MRGIRIPAWSGAVLAVIAPTISACSHAQAPGAAQVRCLSPRRAQLERLVEQISQPHSGRYHRFLTPREFAERFAPTAAQTRAVTIALQRAGFEIVQTYPGGSLILARAATANAERFFNDGANLRCTSRLGKSRNLRRV